MGQDDDDREQGEPAVELENDVDAELCGCARKPRREHEQHADHGYAHIAERAREIAQDATRLRRPARHHGHHDRTRDHDEEDEHPQQHLGGDARIRKPPPIQTWRQCGAG